MIGSWIQPVNKTKGMLMISWGQVKLMDRHVYTTKRIAMILVCSLDAKIQNVNKTTGISMNLVCSLKPNRDLVLRDQKVFPEVRSRPLLPRDFSAIRPYEFLS